MERLLCGLLSLTIVGYCYSGTEREEKKVVIVQFQFQNGSQLPGVAHGALLFVVSAESVPRGGKNPAQVAHGLRRQRGNMALLRDGYQQRARIRSRRHVHPAELSRRFQTFGQARFCLLRLR